MRHLRQLHSWGRIVLALAAAIALVALLILVLGASPAQAFLAMVQGSVVGAFNLGQTLSIASILALTGLAAAIPFSARLWNIGGEGQMYAGAIVAAGLGVTLPGDWPRWLLIPVIVLAASAGGALWGLIPGILKARFDASEVVTSLMLNFVALLIVDFAIGTLWPQGFGPQTRTVVANAVLPRVWPGTLLNAGVFLSLAALIVAWLLVSRTVFGFSLRAVGANPDAARLAGVRNQKLTWVCFAVGGSFAGVAGAIAVLGVNRALVSGFSANYGFLGMAVALLAGLNPAWIGPSAVFFAALRVGSNTLKAVADISPSIGDLLVAVFVLLLIAAEVIRFRYPTGASGDR